MPLLSQSDGNSFSTRSDSVIKSSKTFNHEFFPLLAVMAEDLHKNYPKITGYSKQTIQSKTLSPLKNEVINNK